MKFVRQEDKNKLLKQERNISFEQVVFAIENKQIVDIMEHPNQEKYKRQKFILVEINSYVRLSQNFSFWDNFLRKSRFAGL